MNAAEQQEFGRTAQGPGEIPRRGWWDVLRRVKDEITGDNLTLVAAGVAFYALLAIFPATVAAVSIYGLVAEPQQIRDQLGGLVGQVPGGAGDLLVNQLAVSAEKSGGGLTLGLVLGVLLALWSASGGVSALMTGLNVVHNEREERGFVRLKGTALLLTLGAIGAVLVVVPLIAVFPVVIDYLHLGTAGTVLANVLRWVVVAVLAAVGLAVFYRYGPDRANPRWRWVSTGAGLAVVLWLAASALFSLYVSYFSSYDKTYGALAGVVVLMLWLFLSAFLVLLGAELDAELEHQTTEDTTTGPARPMGERDALMADTVGKGADSENDEKPVSEQGPRTGRGTVD